MSLGEEPVLFMEKRIFGKDANRFYQDLMKGFIVLIGEREDFRKKRFIGYRDITLLGENTVMFDLIDGKHF